MEEEGQDTRVRRVEDVARDPEPLRDAERIGGQRIHDDGWTVLLPGFGGMEQRRSWRRPLQRPTRGLKHPQNVNLVVKTLICLMNS